MEGYDYGDGWIGDNDLQRDMQREEDRRIEQAMDFASLCDTDYYAQLERRGVHSFTANETEIPEGDETE
jgi:hypothetical protein